MMGSFITNFCPMWVSSIPSLERQFWTSKMFSINRFRDTTNNSWKCNRDIKGKYPSRPLTCPRAQLCLPSSAAWPSSRSTAAISRGWRASCNKSPGPEVRGSEGWVGDTLTDADKHQPLKLCGQSVWFLSLPLPPAVCRNCFLWYYSKDGSFLKINTSHKYSMFHLNLILFWNNWK